MSHPIVHVEIPAQDLQAAGEFYARLFGWQVNIQPDYAGFRTGSGSSGGFNPIGSQGRVPIEPGKVMIYVDAEDIDGTLEQAQALGGRVVVPKTEIPGAGWFAVFADPTGNNIGLLHFNQALA